MRKRLVLAAVCILSLPIWFAPIQGDQKLINSAPYASVVYAGHTLGGSYCQCGCQECICEPDEQAGLCIQSVQQVATSDSSQGKSSPINVDSTTLNESG